MMPRDMFQNSADLYDALVNWPKRLATEEPFYRSLFEQANARSVLDVACGNGHHLAMFNSWGLHSVGADVSPEMIEFCRRRFGQTESLHWMVCSFDEPHDTDERFDAVICVGNSLALAPDLATAEQAVRQMLAALRPGGVCVIQVLNLWRLPDGPCVWQKCKRVTLDGREHILVKGVHRSGPRGYVDLIDLELASASVTPNFNSMALLAFEQDRLARVARESGAASTQFYGDFQKTPYQRDQSPDLILVATK